MRMRHRKSKGFTLIELTLVLGAMSLVMAAIWAAGQHVWDDYRINRVNRQIMTTVQNIRSYYGSAINAWSWASGTDKTGAFDTAGLIPPEMRRNPASIGTSPIDHALNNNVSGGSFYILIESNAVSGVLNAFRLQLKGVSQAACIKLLMTAPVAETSVGFVQIGTQGMASSSHAVINNGDTNGSVTAYTMLSATANAWCNDPSSNEVDFDFRL